MAPKIINLIIFLTIEHSEKKKEIYRPEQKRDY